MAHLNKKLAAILLAGIAVISSSVSAETVERNLK